MSGMKQTLLLMVVLLFTAKVGAQSRKQAKEYKIKSTTETTTLFENGKEGVTYKSSYKAFDKDGNVIEEVDYNKDGSTRKRVRTKYAGKEKSEEIVENNKSAKDNSEDPKYSRTTWKHNGNGDKVEETQYDQAGNIIQRTTFTYNSKGEKLMELTMDASGKIIRKEIYVYNAKGLKTEKKIYGPNDTLIKVIKYTYA
jgi:hypothetical protein